MGMLGLLKRKLASLIVTVSGQKLSVIGQLVLLSSFSEEKITQMVQARQRSKEYVAFLAFGNKTPGKTNVKNHYLLLHPFQNVDRLNFLPLSLTAHFIKFFLQNIIFC